MSIRFGEKIVKNKKGIFKWLSSGTALGKGEKRLYESEASDSVQRSSEPAEHFLFSFDVIRLDPRAQGSERVRG